MSHFGDRVTKLWRHRRDRYRTGPENAWPS